MRIVLLRVVETFGYHRTACAVEVVEIQLAESQMIEVPEHYVGTHNEVARDLSLNANVEV